MCTLKTSLVCKQQILIASHAFCEVVDHLFRVGFFCFCFSREREANILHRDRGGNLLNSWLSEGYVMKYY